jgi:two-component system response regulator MprA
MAHNGHEAIRLFSDRRDLDVLVLDIGLPDADGRDVCQALRAGGQTVPVLFLTALDRLHDTISGFHAGGDDYLSKPFAVSELLVRLEALARRRADSDGRPSTGVRLDPKRFA